MEGNFNCHGTTIMNLTNIALRPAMVESTLALYDPPLSTSTLTATPIRTDPNSRPKNGGE
ncbi:hypothetical protein Csa_021585 [Cucumis sativus]|uniref:Uncharacterized protein n=1 Tax=Cucumis sativus TaxID=3659 RepID=A0A0A0KYR5_CUCSA|nr:hypothetical protein Csa_021585 [Cucumis sativus]